MAAAGLGAAACGGASSSAHTSKTASGKFAAGLAFARCMRAHGVNVPDPSPGGHGIHIQISSGDLNSPAFKAAQSACGKLLPGGGPGSGHPTAQDRAAMLRLSQCMRSHGISGFPDPTTTRPSAPPSGHTAVLGRDGLFLVIPGTIDTTSPAFKRAASACHFPGG